MSSRGAAARLITSIGLLATAGCLGTPTPLQPNLSGSVGVPHHGVQTGAVQLPVRGPGYMRLRPRSLKYWGQPRLVAAIQRAAARVAKEMPGGKRALIGDLSARHGGKIPGHHSHRTGRDVDILWYVTTTSGAPTYNPGFIHVESDGLAKLHGAHAGPDFLQLDVPRQWLLIKDLLENPDANVQWIFASRNVEALLTDYARALGESPALIWHAETVLLQPGDSSPHDDHIHVRLACLPDESVRGCEGGGPYWNWLPALPVLPALGDRQLDSLGADDPLAASSAARVIDRLLLEPAQPMARHVVGE